MCRSRPWILNASLRRSSPPVPPHAPAVCTRTTETLVELLGLEGPSKERAWDILDDADLDALKLQAHDLYEGALASQKRRKALRK